MIGAKSQTELTDWYSAANVFCLASHREGCPNVVLEAMACGLPVLAADVGVVKELIIADSLGRVISPPTAENFADGIRLAFQTGWKREEIARLAATSEWSDVARETERYFTTSGIGDFGKNKD